GKKERGHRRAARKRQFRAGRRCWYGTEVNLGLIISGVGMNSSRRRRAAPMRDVRRARLYKQQSRRAVSEKPTALPFPIRAIFETGSEGHRWVFEPGATSLGAALSPRLFRRHTRTVRSDQESIQLRP